MWRGLGPFVHIAASADAVFSYQTSAHDLLLDRVVLLQCPSLPTLVVFSTKIIGLSQLIRIRPRHLLNQSPLAHPFAALF